MGTKQQDYEEQSVEDIFGSGLGLFGETQFSLGDSDTGYDYEIPLVSDFIKQRLREPTQNSLKLKLCKPDNDTNDSNLFAHFVWNCSLVAADYFMEYSNVKDLAEEDDIRNKLSNKRVLELGAGAGLPALMAALCGARFAVCTDYSSDAIIEPILYNFIYNLNEETLKKTRVFPMSWGESPELLNQLDIQTEINNNWWCSCYLDDHDECQGCQDKKKNKCICLSCHKISNNSNISNNNHNDHNVNNNNTVNDHNNNNNYFAKNTQRVSSNTWLCKKIEELEREQKELAIESKKNSMNYRNDFKCNENNISSNCNSNSEKLAIIDNIPLKEKEKKFNIIVLADTVWLSDQHENLALTCSQCLAEEDSENNDKDEDGNFILCISADHSMSNTHGRFYEALEKYGIYVKNTKVHRLKTEWGDDFVVDEWGEAKRTIYTTILKRQ